MGSVSFQRHLRQSMKQLLENNYYIDKNIMQIKIITVGEPKLSFVKDGFNEYIKRLKRFHKITVQHLVDSVTDVQILKTIDTTFCVVLDEGGKEFSSRVLAEFLDKKVLHGVGAMCFVIGGPDGHSNVIKNRADLVWSVSQLTFPHDLAMLVVAEALYRASTITVNHPYHRD